MKSFILLFLTAAVTFALPSPEREEFIFAVSGEPDSLDPQTTEGTLTFQIVRSLYDTLVEPETDTSGKLLPALAESWEVSDDERFWTFFLRKGVRFHHQKQLTAEDVVATFTRIQDSATASPKQAEYEAIQRVYAEGEHIVHFELSRPHSPLLSTLASGWSAILPADLIASGHNFATSPVGTGPFRFSLWEADRKIRLLRNDDYWQAEKPHISTLEFAIFTDPALQAQALIAGSIDGIDIVVEPELSLLRDNPQTQVYESLSSLVLVLSLNTRVAELAQREFREAIAASIDRQQVLDIAYGGGVPVNTFMDESNPYYIDMPAISKDPQWIRQTFTRLRPSRSLVITVPSNYQPHVNAAQLYQEMLREMGLAVELKLVDWSRWLSEVYRGFDFEMTVIGHTGELDPDPRLSLLGKGESYVGWENKEFVALLDQARQLASVDERKALYAQALKIVGEDLPFVYIGTPYRNIGLAKNVQNFAVNGQLDTYDFRNLKLQ